MWPFKKPAQSLQCDQERFAKLVGDLYDKYVVDNVGSMPKSHYINLGRVFPEAFDTAGQLHLVIGWHRGRGIIGFIGPQDFEAFKDSAKDRSHNYKYNRTNITSVTYRFEEQPETFAKNFDTIISQLSAISQQLIADIIELRSNEEKHERDHEICRMQRCHNYSEGANTLEAFLCAETH